LNFLISETVLSTILQVSLTGGGLVLAIYGIVIPLSKNMFTQRVKELSKQIEKFEQHCKELNPINLDAKIKKLQKISQEINEKKLFPDILHMEFILFLRFTLRW